MRTIGPALLMALGPALMALALIFAACTKAVAPVSAPSPTATPAAPRAPVASPTPIGKATPAPTAVPTVVVAPETFFLEIVTPKDESVVQESSVQVRGRTVPDAVVSVNGQPVEVDASGIFTATIALEIGPNSVEVIASDFRGNQQSRVISLVYTG